MDDYIAVVHQYPAAVAVTFLLLGVIGEYVGNIIHTLNSTPQYVIRSRVGISGEADDVTPQFANKDSGCYNEMSGENPLIEEVRR